MIKYLYLIKISKLYIITQIKSKYIIYLNHKFGSMHHGLK